MRVLAKAYDLIFKSPAGTSRGTLRSKRSWFLIAETEAGLAVGECGIFAGLSHDDRADYETRLLASIDAYQAGRLDLESYREWPSIVIGWEILLADIANHCRHIYLDNSFSSGKPIPINGLIWMGDQQAMSQQIREKLAAGFSCIKLKIGAIDFDKELELLAGIRKEYSVDEIELRLDANGAFSPAEALEKLKRLSAYDIHSIEQPIKAGQVRALAAICQSSPIDIALDEELIGVVEPEAKTELIRAIRPQYIILKPSLIGGFRGSDEWIAAAEQLGIPWWATSALESNIGLQAIAHWTASKHTSLPQGLGTGQMYTNNFPSPLQVRQGQLRYDSDDLWDLSALI